MAYVIRVPCWLEKCSLKWVLYASSSPMRNLLFFLQPIQSSYCQKTEFGRAFLHSTFFLEKSDSKILRIKDLFLYHFDLETKKLVNDCWFCRIYSLNTFTTNICLKRQSKLTISWFSEGILWHNNCFNYAS